MIGALKAWVVVFVCCVYILPSLVGEIVWWGIKLKNKKKQSFKNTKFGKKFYYPLHWLEYDWLEDDKKKKKQ